MSLNSFVKLIKKHYPKEKEQYAISENNASDTIKTFLKKEFSNSTYTLSMDIITPFIEKSKYIQINYERITFNCAAPSDEMPPILYLLRIVKRVVCLLRLFSIEKSYTIWLLPIKERRFFPNAGEMVGPKHINGGYTYVSGTTIFVYRFEECAKVILHEILHHSPFDTHGCWASTDIEKIRSLCNIHSDVILNVNEAIVEFWAVFFECLFVSHEYHLPILMLLKKEQDWSQIQSSKLIIYQRSHFPKWKEETNAYCYIVIKAILLKNYEDFIKIHTPYSSEILSKFIMDNMNTLIIATKIKSIEKTSMRMTLFGDI